MNYFSLLLCLLIFCYLRAARLLDCLRVWLRRSWLRDSLDNLTGAGSLIEDLNQENARMMSVIETQRAALRALEARNQELAAQNQELSERGEIYDRVNHLTALAYPYAPVPGGQLQSCRDN